jgi:hypothetical protein
MSLPLLCREKVGFVDEQQISAFSLPRSLFSFCTLDVLDIRLEIFTSKLLRITCIHDLHNQVGAFNDPP